MAAAVHSWLSDPIVGSETTREVASSECKYTLRLAGSHDQFQPAPTFMSYTRLQLPTIGLLPNPCLCAKAEPGRHFSVNWKIPIGFERDREAEPDSVA